MLIKISAILLFVSSSLFCSEPPGKNFSSSSEASKTNQCDITSKLIKKLEDLSPLMKHKYQLSVDLETIPLIVRIVAPYDVNLAQSYANQLTFEDLTKAYIEISKCLCPEEAQTFLNQFKQENFCLRNSDLILICREEYRRDLSDKEQTLDRIKEDMSWDYLQVADLLLDCGLELPEEHLEQAHKTKIESCSRLNDPQINQYGLVHLLKVEGKAQNSLAFDTIEIIRANIEKIRNVFSDNTTQKFNSGHSATKYIEAWVLLINAEATSPFFASELNKDLAFILKATKELKQIYPEETEEFDLQLSFLDALVPHYPDEALKVLDAIDDEWYYFFTLIDLIENGHPHQKELLQTLFRYSELIPLPSSEMYIHLAHCVALIDGIDQALPFLEKAKASLVEITDEEVMEDALVEMLKFEIKHQLPSAKQTLMELHQTISKIDSPLIDTIPVVVNAELFLITSHDI
jgi:hypothetical protein